MHAASMQWRFASADIPTMTKATALFCMWVACAPAQEPSQLVGRWRSAETSKGGIGAMYDFMANGTIQFSPGAIVQEKYQISGDQLTIGSGKDSVQYTLTFTGADHLRMGVNGQGEDLTRLGRSPDPQRAILGEWTGTRDMQGQKVLVHWIFSVDSNSLLMIRFTTQSGTYTVQNGRLVATFGGRAGLDGPITITNGVLVINRSGGRVTTLERY